MTINEQKEVLVEDKKSGKRKGLKGFLNFLIMGGWLLIALLIFGGIILYYTIFPYSK